jgi:hypothetical protein
MVTQTERRDRKKETQREVRRYTTSFVSFYLHFSLPSGFIRIKVVRELFVF